MPYSSMPEAIAPSTKYFIADFGGEPESRSNATIAYSDSDSNSRPRYTVSRLPAETITIMPSSANSTEHEELALEQAALAAGTRASTANATATVP